MELQGQDLYDALTVVSPAQLGEESKDQDRARWYDSVQVAALCDGVTCSPYGGAAAELVVSLAPMLFAGVVEERIRATSELLVAYRLQAQRQPVSFPPEASPSVRLMLGHAAARQLATAYQTTLVAAAFTMVHDHVQASILRCGDSAFFAFTPDGEPLTGSCSSKTRPGSTELDDGRFWYGPGDELLVKIIGTAKDRPQLAETARIEPKYAANWLLCVPLDQCPSLEARAAARDNNGGLGVHKDDTLVVPRYLPERIVQLAGGDYARVRYSSTIRLISKSAGPSLNVRFDAKGSVTEVLPDHFYSGGSVHTQEHFPQDTRFLLASDGFYGAFQDALEMWSWLRQNEARVRDPGERGETMQRLHERLHTLGGDDDISFVWVYPPSSHEHSAPETSASHPSEEGTRAG